MAGEKSIWATNIKFAIVKFLDNNNAYTMTSNYCFKILYVAWFEQLIT